MIGPMTTPALVAADSHPRAFARSAGAMVSATYACATPVAPPPAPWTARDANRSHSPFANPKIRDATPDPASPVISARRRQEGPETLPDSREATRCAADKPAAH